MTETKRKKVSILEICSAKIAEFNFKINEAQNSKIEAEANLKTLDKKFIAEIKSLKNELLKTTALITEVVKEGVDSQKLDQKSKDITSKIFSIEAARINSLEVENTKKVFAEIEIGIKKLETLKTEWETKQKLAEKLKASYELDNRTGAVSVLEFETLDDAVKEYLDNIPVIISISEDMTINRLALWPYADQPNALEFDLFASNKGDRFLYNKLPGSLSWLSNFENSIYGKMRFDNAEVFNSNGVTFVINSEDSSDVSQNKHDTISKKWYGENMGTFYSNYSEKGFLETPKDSIFSPEGFKWSARSGFCYIKSEEKFYSFFNTDFTCSELSTKQVEKFDRSGYRQIVKEDFVNYIKLDMSVLMDSFTDVIKKSFKLIEQECISLVNSKSCLALRVLGAIKNISVLEPIFEHRDERLSSKQIADEIGAYWDAFIAAPWESTVVGSVAMIKHLCERKIESPHVWSYPTKGHFGLRVRTRDHDWIIVQIYCPPSYLSPETPIKHSAVEYSPSVKSTSKDKYVTVGQCFLVVYNTDE